MGLSVGTPAAAVGRRLGQQVGLRVYTFIVGALLGCGDDGAPSAVEN